MAKFTKENADQLKTKLTELALYEEGMTIIDMRNIMEAVNNSYASAENEKNESKAVVMKRNYIHVHDRRMPWCLFPVSKQLTVQQRINILTAYKEQQNICRYRKAKSSSVFAEWEVKSCIQFSNNTTNNINISSGQYSRRGRLLNTCPQYKEEISDSEDSPTKKKGKRKLKKLTNAELIAKSSLFQDEMANDDVMIMNTSNVENKYSKLNSTELNFYASSSEKHLNGFSPNTIRDNKRDANDDSNVASITIRDKKRMKISEER